MLMSKRPDLLACGEVCHGIRVGRHSGMRLFSVVLCGMESWRCEMIPHSGDSVPSLVLARWLLSFNDLVDSIAWPINACETHTVVFWGKRNKDRLGVCFFIHLAAQLSHECLTTLPVATIVICVLPYTPGS